MTSRPVAIDEQGTADLSVDSRQVGTADGVPVVRQVVAIGAGDAPDSVIDTTGGTLPVADANLPDYTGVWAYAAGTSGTPTIPGTARVLSISAVGGTGGGTVTVDAGDSITVPEAGTFVCNPEANLVGPVVVFTGTSSYFVDWIV